jgi:hypothetical protein
MKTSHFLIALCCASLTVFSAYAEDAVIAFKPPQLGAPATRIGGGTRGLGSDSVTVQVLAPSQISYTSSSSPTLYWYLSEASKHDVEISLTIDNKSEPVLEKNLGAVAKSGIQAIRLSDFGVQLKPNQDYRWAVAVVNDPNQRSNDAFASATVRLQALSQPLTDPAALAAAGYWYDTLDQLIVKKSNQVNTLLEQGGITLSDIH